MLHTGEEFNEANARVRELTLKPLEKMANREPLDGNDLKDLEASLPIIDRIIKFDPSTLEGYALKGKVLKATGDFNGALRVLQFGLGTATVDQGNYADLVRADMYSEAASIYSMRKQYEDAQMVLGHAIRLAPSDPRFLYESAEIAALAGQREKAKELLQGVFAIDSDYGRAKTLWRSLREFE